MADVLVLVEHDGSSILKTTRELLTAARQLGEPAAVVVGEPGVGDALTSALSEAGAQKIYVAEAEGVSGLLSTPSVQALATIATESQPTAILVAGTSAGKEIAGRLAVRLASGVITEVTGFADGGTATTSIFAGAMIVNSKVRKGIPIYAIRPGAVDPDPQAVANPDRRDVSLTLPEGGARLGEKVTEAKGSRPELTEARIVVAGGRGVGEKFALVEELADLLGGAVGASRAATDGGFYSHQFQVGQTGKTVSPQVYIACGISGAIQHRSGMQTSRIIVVINKDAEAPLFEIADFGIVGDLFTVIPQVIEELKKRA